MIPLVTGEQWAEQLAATAAGVVELDNAVSARLPGNRAALDAPLARQWGAWKAAWDAFVRGARMPPLLPLPPPLPSIFVRPGAWQTLVGWDTALRAWSARWRRAGVADAPLPPPALQPPLLNPGELGLGLGTGISLGTGLLVLGAVLYLTRR